MNATAPESAWRVGDVIDGIYEVRAEITSGGMGVVHRVYHRGWNVELAVKTPRRELVSSPQRIADFQTEAETWVGLGLHPHVVACVYVRRLDGLPRVFAEWVDGGSLGDAVESGRLYEGSPGESLARMLDMAIQFAWGLDYAHSRGLVHQDVKPANVMLTSDWTAKVTDFGLAKARAVAGETTAGTRGMSVLAGYGGMTPAYCSPEQASAAHASRTGDQPAPLTRATDAWSWAISVWEMFTGEPPCQHGQAAAEAFTAFREDSRVNDPRIPALPDGVAELLTRCLDPNPTTRPRRMGELADELVRLYPRLLNVAYPRTKTESATLVADGLNNQALSMLDLGRMYEAEQLWHQALAIDPHHLDAVYNQRLHRWRRAEITDSTLLAELEDIRLSHPGPHGDHLLALVHLERCDSATARALLTAAARAAPNDRAIAEALAAARGQADLKARTLTGHTDWVQSVAVSADAHTAVSASQDKTVRVWDLGSGACLRILTGHTEQVRGVAMSADARIAVSGGDRTVRVWDLASGICLRTLTGHTDEVRSVAMSADGHVAVSGNMDGTMRVWDLASGACLQTLSGHWNSVNSVAVSADARIAVSGSWDDTVRVWDLRSGACLHTLDHQRPLESVAISPDARIAVSAASSDETVRLWDLASGACIRTLTGHAQSANSVAVSADARIAFSGGWDNAVRVWDLASGVCLRTLAGHTHPVISLAVSADARIAVSGSYDTTVRVWDVPTARGHSAGWSYTRPHSAVQLLAGAAAVAAAAGRAEMLLSAGNGAGAAAQLRTARAIPGYQREPGLVDLWHQLAGLGFRGRLQDAWQQPSLTGHTAPVRSVAVSADGRVAASGGIDGTLRVWDLASGSCLHTLTGHTRLAPSVALSADARIAVSFGLDQTVRVWDLASGAGLHMLAGHTVEYDTDYRYALSAGQDRVAVSADGRIVVSGGQDQTVRVWDLANGACLHTLSGHTRWVTSVAVSADGRVAVSGGDSTVRVWDLASGTCLHTLAGHTSRVKSVAASADGRIAVSGGGFDNTVRVWDLASGTCLHTLTGENSEVQSVAVSADARVAVSSSGKGTVRVWDIAGGAYLRTLTGDSGPVGSVAQVWSVALSADARIAVFGSQDNTVQVWTLDWDYEFAADEG
ncbi:MAG: protein kinase domain-containing protein [Mycobacterium sp.]